MRKYDWLLVKNGKLGCSTCKEVGILSVKKKTGMKISKEWANVETDSYGDTKQKKQKEKDFLPQRECWS